MQTLRQSDNVSVNINFGAKMSFCAKKIEILGEMLTTTESDYLFAKYAYF